jgi:hypothetical protein
MHDQQTGGQYKARCINGMVLLAKLDGRQNTWHYNSPLWTDTSVLNGSSLLFDHYEAKLEAFNRLPVSSLRLGMSAIDAPSNAVRWVTVELQSQFPSLQAALSTSGRNTGFFAGVGRSTWKSLIGPAASLQPNCNRYAL